MRAYSILTSKHISLTVRGKVFDACVRSAFLHGSATWAPTAPDLQRLHRNDRPICSLGGIDPQNRTAWRSGIRSISRMLPTPTTWTPTADDK